MKHFELVKEYAYPSGSVYVLYNKEKNKRVMMKAYKILLLSSYDNRKDLFCQNMK